MTRNPVWESTRTWMDSFQQTLPAALPPASCLLKKFLSCTCVTKFKISYLVYQNLNNTCLCDTVCDTEAMHHLFVCIFSVLYTKKTWVWLGLLAVTWLKVIHSFNTVLSISEGHFLPECLSEPIISICLICEPAIHCIVINTFSPACCVNCRVH